jgi:putative FmdB family regulatory protein
MPTFDFRCKKCEKPFEATIPFGSKQKPKCPSCGAKTTEKLLTPPLGIHFKGSGFYKTDSRAGILPTGRQVSPAAEKPPVEKDTKPASEPKSTPSSKPKDVE